MKIAVIGSRGLTVKDLADYLPSNVTEIVSGGAVGIDTCAKEYGLRHIRFHDLRHPYVKLMTKNNFCFNKS